MTKNQKKIIQALGDYVDVCNSGGKGARRIPNLCGLCRFIGMGKNELMAELFCLEKEAGFPFQHIHAVGSYGWSWMPDLVASKGVDLTKTEDIRMVQYIYNMPTVVAAADVFIGRAGASTCNEIAASGTPCILIPSPNVTNNHQEMNARVLAENGGATLILEKDCTAQKLFDEIKVLAENKEKASSMRAALLKIAVPDSAERLCDIMYSLAQPKE